MRNPKMCLFSTPPWANVFPQISHRWFFSFKWTSFWCTYLSGSFLTKSCQFHFFHFERWKDYSVCNSKNGSNFCTDNYHGQRALLLSVVFCMHKSAVRKMMWFSSKRDAAWKLMEFGLLNTWSTEMNHGKVFKHLSWLSWWIFIKIHWHSSPW